LQARIAEDRETRKTSRKILALQQHELGLLKKHVGAYIPDFSSRRIVLVDSFNGISHVTEAKRVIFYKTGTGKQKLQEI
jgi:hypothetical protein